MLHRRSACICVCLGALLGGPVTTANATESGGGRPVAGTAVNPGAGALPDQPLWLFNLGLQAVDGKIGASRQTAVAGRIAADAENRYTAQSFTLLKVWEPSGAWRLASSVSVLAMQTEVEISGFVPAVAGLSLRDRASGLYDLAVTPVIASYPISKDEHIALSLRIWAPTGRYVPGQLANLSQNVWTFIPTVAYTRFLQQGWEASAVGTVNFATRNESTNYQSAPLFTLDLMATRKLADGWAVGGIVGWIEQIGHDSGPLADRLNGFKGREIALGPIVTYSTKVGPLPLSTSLRWLSTVYNRDRMDRDTLYLSFTLPLPL